MSNLIQDMTRSERKRLAQQHREVAATHLAAAKAIEAIDKLSVRFTLWKKRI